MSWGVLEPSWGRFGAVLGAFFAPWGRLFFGVYFGVILDAILDHFGVDVGSNFRPFWGDEDDDDDDGDDDDDDDNDDDNEGGADYNDMITNCFFVFLLIVCRC